MRHLSVMSPHHFVSMSHEGQQSRKKREDQKAVEHVMEKKKKNDSFCWGRMNVLYLWATHDGPEHVEQAQLDVTGESCLLETLWKRENQHTHAQFFVMQGAFRNFNI